MEVDNEVSRNGNSYTTEFRQYDPRLGRWKSLDPLMAKYPNQSPYVAFNNNPIFFTDPFGDDPPEGCDLPPAQRTDGGGDLVDWELADEWTTIDDNGNVIDFRRTYISNDEGDLEIGWKHSVNEEKTDKMMALETIVIDNLTEEGKKNLARKENEHSGNLGDPSDYIGMTFSGPLADDLSQINELVGIYGELDIEGPLSGYTIGLVYTGKGWVGYETGKNSDGTKDGFTLRSEILNIGLTSGYVFTTGNAKDVTEKSFEGTSFILDVSISAVVGDVGLSYLRGADYNENGDHLIFIGGSFTGGIGTPFVSGGVSNQNSTKVIH